ncbi:hypothetical protein GCM10027162_38550 [Streptomyces incanus]
MGKPRGSARDLPGSRSPGLGTYVQHASGPPAGPGTPGGGGLPATPFDGARRSWIPCPGGQVSGWMSRSGGAGFPCGAGRGTQLQVILQGAHGYFRPRCFLVHSTASAYRASAPCRVGS